MRQTVRGPGLRHRQARQPRGVAIGTDLKQAYDLAFATDPTSAFGGIIAFNRPLDAETATAIVERQFVEVIIAPEITPEAAEAISGKKNVRLLACGAFDSERTPGSDYKRITGGLLVQDRDLGMVDANNLQMVTERSPPRMSWKTCSLPGKWPSTSNPTPSSTPATAAPSALAPAR